MDHGCLGIYSECGEVGAAGWQSYARLAELNLFIQNRIMIRRQEQAKILNRKL